MVKWHPGRTGPRQPTVTRSPRRKRWHSLLGALLDALLSPVGVTVQTEVEVMAAPPRADLLLCREGDAWSAAQRERLADGLRHTEADHLLVEFKRTEGLKIEAFRQLLSYDHHYLRRQGLERGRLASFLVSATTPTGDLLARLGYRPTSHAGVYGCAHPLLESLGVILLNELSAAAHNTPIKVFASRRREQERAFAALRDSAWLRSSTLLERLVYGLWRLLMKNAPDIDELTPEYVAQAGQEWIEAILKATPVEEVVRHYSPEEVMCHYSSAERLAGMAPDERLAGMAPGERLAGLDDEQIRDLLERLQRNRPK